MDNTVIVALIVMVGAQIGPWILAHQVNKARASDKAEDWKRQDIVADRAAAAAAAAQLSAKEIIQTSDKIHTLVNSNMGAQLKATAFFSRSNANSLRRISEMTKNTDDVRFTEEADISAKDAEEKLLDHERKQAVVDAGDSAK